MRRRLGWLLFLCLPWVFTPGLRSADRDQKPRYETRKEHDPEGFGKFYMDREIAQVMGHQAAEWLERPEREQEEQPNKLLKLLDLKPGMVVADIIAARSASKQRSGFNRTFVSCIISITFCMANLSPRRKYIQHAECPINRTTRICAPAGCGYIATANGIF